MMHKEINNKIFEELFVLELANNHWGKVKRGLKIIDDFSEIVRSNKVKAAIKLQFRDVENFIHKEFAEREDIRYIKKTKDTVLTEKEFEVLVKRIRDSGCITMATPFDENSVEMCEKLDIEIIKIASSDINDWILINKIAETGKPVIASTGGANLEDIDNIVEFFNNKEIPFALNHCVSVYPSEDHELNLNEIDFLKARFPNLTIGFSTHEYRNWEWSLMIAYAKGARTFERHIDINYEDVPVSPYCSLPEDIDIWFKAFKKAKEMCGNQEMKKRVPEKKEVNYLENLLRGVYARAELIPGTILTEENTYLAIPLQKGQLSSREFRYGEVLKEKVSKDQAIDIKKVETDYIKDKSLMESVNNRGLDSLSVKSK